MRIEKSIKNVAAASIGQMLSYILGFISRMIFIKMLGSDYLGINGVFTNILTVLSILELGMGASITIFLYKPIAEKNYPLVNSLLKYYKSYYNKLGIIISILALCLIPFLRFIIKEELPNINVIAVYIIFIIINVIPYFVASYKTLIDVRQERYIINIIHYIVNIIMIGFQILALLLYKNYYLYLALQLMFLIIENAIIVFVYNKKYKYKTNEIEKLDEDMKSNVRKKMKSMVAQQAGLIVLNSTDSIVISSMIGVKTVGIYSNYNLIISIVDTILSQIFAAIQSAVGNLYVTENVEKTYSIYKNISFINFWMVAICITELFSLIDPFIGIWIGKEYIMDFKVVIIMIINLMIMGLNRTSYIYKYGIGIIEKDRYASIIGAILNIGISIFLANRVGLIGIFIGTTISILLTKTFVEPYILYRYVFKKNFLKWVLNYLLQVFLIGLICTLCYVCNLTINTSNIFLDFIIKGVVTFIVSNAIIMIFSIKIPECRYFFGIISTFFNKIFKKVKDKAN